MATLFDENRFEAEIDAKVKTIVKNELPKETVHRATVLRQDSSGIWWVRLDSGEETPVLVNKVDMSVGDVVTVTLRDHVTYADGNITSPPMSASNTQQYVGDVVAHNVKALTADIGYLKADVATIGYAQIEDADITNARIQNLVYEVTQNVTHLNAVDASILELQTNSLTANSAVITNLQAETAKLENIEAEDLEATVGYIGDLTAENITASDIIADHADIADLEADNATIKGRLTAAEGNITNLTAADATITGRLDAAEGNITNLTAADATITGRLDAAEASVGSLEAATADIGTIRANSAKVQNLTAEQLSAATGYVGSLTAGNISAADIIADHATVSDLDATYATIDVLESDYITASTIESNYTKTDFSNTTVSWIQNGTIKNAAITNEMVQDISANKLTAGTINGSVINVTNLNADNITTGTINGQRIGEGSLSLDKLSEDVYTEAEVDSIVDGLNDRIDGAIESHTGDAVPTLQNSPASSWNTVALKDEHVGDVYYVVNSNIPQNGYCYRFTKSGTGASATYSWQLIKDSDVTKALAELQTAQEDIAGLGTRTATIEQFDSTVSSFMTNTDTELSSLKTRTTTMETNVQTAQATANGALVDTVQLWFTKADTTAPSKPTAHVTSTATTGNAWTTKVPTYSASYPHYYYCYEYKKADGTYAWSAVVHDEATCESQAQARTGVANAAAAQATANKNVKESIQLWFTKANGTAPGKPTSVVTSTATTGNTWTTKVPVYNASYPYYFYCWQYKLADGTYAWSDVVEDKAMAEVQTTARTAASNASSALSQVATKVETSVFNELSQTVDENSSSITTLSSTTQQLRTDVDGKASQSDLASTTTLVNSVQQTANANSASITSLTTTTQQLSSDLDDLESSVTTLSTTTTNKFNTVDQTLDGIETSIGNIEDTLETKADGSTVSSLSSQVNTISDTVAGHTQSISSINSTLSTKADGSTVSTLSTKVNNISDTVDGHTSSLSSITTEQASIKQNAVKSTVQLWFTKVDATAPSKPTAHVTTNSSSTPNAWNLAVPTYNASYPNYYYCYEYQYVDGSYGWSAVTRDIATGESQQQARKGVSDAAAAQSTANTANTNASNAVSTANTAKTTAEGAAEDASTALSTANAANTNASNAVSTANTANTNASNAVSTANTANTNASNAVSTANTAKTTADKNVRTSQQLWFTKANSDAPAKPSGTNPVTSTATTGNAWTTKVPVYNASYPHYFYCMQYIAADGTVSWSDVVYDQATTEAQSVARTAAANYTSISADYANYKQTTTENFAQIGTTYATKTELTGSVADLESQIADTTYTKFCNGTFKAGRNGLKSYTLCMRDEFGDWTSIVNEYSTGTAKTPCTYGLQLGNVLYYSSGTNSVAAGSTGGDGLWESYPCDMRYSMNVTTSSFTVGKPVYLVGTLDDDDGMFYLDTAQWWTQAPNATSKVYIHLGTAYSAYQIFLAVNNPSYVYNGSELVEFAYSRIRNAETSIEQTNEQIALKANASDVYTKTQTDGLISTESSNRTSAINQKASEITASVASTYTTKTEFNNLEIGGRNLLGNTDNPSAPTLINSNAANTFGSIGSYNTPATSISVEEYDDGSNALTATETATGNRGVCWYTKPGAVAYGETVTFSCIVYSSVTTTAHTHLAYRNASSTAAYAGWSQPNGGTITLAANAWTAYSFTFTNPSAYPDYELLVAMCVTGNSSGLTWKIAHAKLERGNKATDWTPAPEDLEAYTDSQVSAAEARIAITTDGISSEVSKISSAKYVNAAAASWTLANIKTWAAEGYSSSWGVASTASFRVGDTVYIKGTDSTRQCPIYIKTTVTAINSATNFTGTSHGYEDVLPVETIKSTINQSADSVKIQAKHVEIDGAAIFTNSDFQSQLTANYSTTTQMNAAVDAVQDDLNATRSWYAECSTAAAEANKVATITPATTDFALSAGTTVYVKFTVTNSAAVANLTMNVNGTGAMPLKTIRYDNINTIAAAGYLRAGITLQLYYDGANWITNENYNADTQNRIRWQNILAASGTITAGHVICGTASGYRNIAAGLPFDLSYPLLYAETSIAAGATSGTRDNNYLQINSVSATINGTIEGATIYKTIFLKGTVSGNTFTIAASPFLTCTPPTAATDPTVFYVPIGMLYSASAMYFSSSKDLYAFIDGKFRQVTPTEIVATQRIYYRSKVSGTVPKPTAWVTAPGNVWNDTVSVGDSGWTTKVPPITRDGVTGAAKYLYLYTCEQRKRLDGTVECTAVALDENTTIIDGGQIITNSITAEKIQTNTITVGSLRDGSNYATNSSVASAAQTATSYITEIGDDGIKVHPEADVDYTYSKLDGTGLETVADGWSTAKFGTVTYETEYGYRMSGEARIGLLAHGHMLLGEDGLAYKQGDQVRFSVEPQGDETVEIAQTYGSQRAVEPGYWTHHWSSDLTQGDVVTVGVPLDYAVVWCECTSGGVRTGDWKPAYECPYGGDSSTIDLLPSGEVYYRHVPGIRSIGVLEMQAYNKTSSYVNILVAQVRDARRAVVRVGKPYDSTSESNESHMELDYHSMQMVDREGNTYFHVSDLRNADGEAEMTETFKGDGTTKVFSVLLDVYAEVSATDSSDGGNTATRRIRAYTFANAPALGATVKIVYKTRSSLAKGFTLGRREPDSGLGPLSVAEGDHVTASGYTSHAEGYSTTASANYSHAEGSFTTASGYYSHAEGYYTTASGHYSHAEGYSTTASTHYSHAEGWGATASGVCSHAEGEGATASGRYSHAQNCYTTASGDYSHAQNYFTKAFSDCQTALGRYNVEDANDTYAVIVGNGTANNARSNAAMLDWDGNAELAGGLTLGGGIYQYVADDYSVATSSDVYRNVIQNYDSQNAQIGYMQVNRTQSGVYRSFAVRNPSNSKITALYMQARDDGTGDLWTNAPLRVNSHSSAIGALQSNTATNLTRAGSIDTRALGASVTLTPGSYVIVGRWIFNTGTSGVASRNLEVSLGTGTSSIWASQRVNSYSYGWTALQCTHLSVVTGSSVTVYCMGSGSQATNASYKDTSYIYALRIE